MDRTTAVNALRQTRVFRNTSFRLLADLIEKAENETAGDAVENRGDAALVLVVDGEVSVVEGSLPAKRIPPGRAYWPEEPDLRFHDEKSPRRVVTEDSGEFVKLTRDFLLAAHRASFSLFTSLDFTDWTAYRELAARDETPIPLHFVWVCGAPDVDLPLEAMTHLLAISVFRSFDEPVAILRAADERITLAVWEPDGFVEAPLTSGKIAYESVSAVLKDRGLRLCHVFVVGPSDPDEIPPRLAGLRFHRIAYVSPGMPEIDVPERLEKTLVAAARNSANPAAPYFSSFVASVLRAEANGQESETFSEPLVDDGDGADAPRRAAVRRMNRDRCRIPFDLDDLSKRWKADPWERFADDLLDEEPYLTIASRWARSLLNRRVGLAVSSGGATSYRMVALIEMLEARGVPIDVLGGISGGALIGAYYCKKGREGLEQCVRNGPWFQGLLLAQVFDSRVVRWKVDYDLGHGSVDDVDTRFVPIVTALRDRERPQAHVICGGTLGEAVQASGSAPGLFGPVDRRNGSAETTRYADGVASRLIPARAVVDYGADLVLAFNTVPAPRRRNPFDAYWLGRFLYDWTPASRLIDIGVSSFFFLEQVSNEIAEDAHVFIEPELRDEPFFQAIQFFNAAGIVEEARQDPELTAGANECFIRWLDFCGAPAVPSGDGTPPSAPARKKKRSRATKRSSASARKTVRSRVAKTKKKPPRKK